MKLELNCIRFKIQYELLYTLLIHTHHVKQKLMKRIFFASILFFGIVVWVGLSRKFIYYKDNICITVWKTFSGYCYIIPEKYYGVFSPKINHIKIANTASIDLYFVDSLPGKIIFRATDSVFINNAHVNKVTFENFSLNFKYYQELLYVDNSFQETKNNVDLIFIDIRDMYGVGANNEKLW